MTWFQMYALLSLGSLAVFFLLMAFSCADEDEFCGPDATTEADVCRRGR